MADDVRIQWTPPILTRLGNPANVLGFKVYERLPGDVVQLAQDVQDPAATEITLLDYATELRVYEFAVAAYNAAGDGPLSPFGSDAPDADVPARMGVPTVSVIPKPPLLV